MQASPRLRTFFSFLLIFLIAHGPLVQVSAAAPQTSNPGQGDANRSDPCTHLPDPPGNANGIDKQCPALGSSNGVSKGDFNGDGVADLAIGVPGSTIGGKANVGLVQVIYGSSNGLTTNTTGVPKPQAFSESSLALLFLPPPAAGDRFGAALASGDFNHDGYSDLAIGVPGKVIPGSFLLTPTSMGAIVVIYGSATGLDPTTAGSFDITDAINFGLLKFPPVSAPAGGFDFSNAQLGASLAWGDFNGDGISDLVAGAPGLSLTSFGVTFATSVGGIWQILGSPGGLDLSAGGSKLLTQHGIDPSLTDDAGDQFGFSLAGGDFNGNGLSGIAVGVPNKKVGSAIDAGMVIVVYGSYLVGLGRDPYPESFATIGQGSLSATGDHFGLSLAARDFNGDGRSDLAIGAPNKAIGPVANAGVVYVLDGSGLVSNVNVTSFNEWDQNKLGGTAETGDRFGSALAANDFNGDGYADLAIGVPFEDVIVSGASIVDAGEVDVIYGSSEGLGTLSRAPQVWTEASPTAGNRFGAPLTAWNFGRNELTCFLSFCVSHGTADLAVGMPYATVNGASGAGAIDVIYGSYFGNGLVPTSRQVLTQATLGVTPQAGAHFGAAMY